MDQSLPTVSIPKNFRFYNDGDGHFQHIKEFLIAQSTKPFIGSVSELHALISQWAPSSNKLPAFSHLESFFKQQQSVNFETFARTVLPRAVASVLNESKSTCEALTLLEIGTNGSCLLTRRQLKNILSHLILGTLYQHESAYDYPDFSLIPLYSQPRPLGFQKLECIFLYVLRVEDSDEEVEFSRHTHDPTALPLDRPLPLSPVHLVSSQTAQPSWAEVVFADSLIGGGILEDGIGQEEALFIQHPECIVSRLFTARLHDNDALIIRNALSLHPPPSRNGREKVCIDALPFTLGSFLNLDEYSPKDITRELNKAYAGFSNRRSPLLLTGKWGCGSFGGNYEMKFLIQWIAFSISPMENQALKWNREYASSSENTAIENFVKEVISRETTVKDLSQALFKAASSRERNIFNEVLRELSL